MELCAASQTLRCILDGESLFRATTDNSLEQDDGQDVQTHFTSYKDKFVISSAFVYFALSYSDRVYCMCFSSVQRIPLLSKNKQTPKDSRVGQLSPMSVTPSIYHC